MAANSGKLANKVMFITGASRGIGRHIALKAAKDGAKIAIAAKTKDPHPKLPGTLYTVAEEIEKAGGQCLPCVVDIRYEDQVENAVNETVKKFGGIDILVNNASAISLTNTSNTAMKTYDLMNSINARGTYLCSKICLPHLRKGNNPHILNLSPPLNMNPVWFKNHVAYTMAKYGMSMCVLGMAEEFASYKIAVNALWPRTAIYTAAMKMLGGGSEDIAKQCRKPEIVADAAYVILTKTVADYSGKFLIDDDVLKSVGVTDFDQYACHPGNTLLPDFFLDDIPAFKPSQQQTASNSSGGSGGLSVSKLFDVVGESLSEEAVKQVGFTFSFNLSGSEPSQWYLDLKNGAGSVGPLKGKLEDYDVQFTMSSEDCVSLFSGKITPTNAFMAGKLKIKGNMMGAMKLEKMMKTVQAKL